MEKSFYYIHDKRSAWNICTELKNHAIPFLVESHPSIKASELVIVFPDLPVRQYAIVHKMFKRVGISYSVS